MARIASYGVVSLLSVALVKARLGIQTPAMEQKDELDFAFTSDLEACREVESQEDLCQLCDTIQSYGDGESCNACCLQDHGVDCASAKAGLPRAELGQLSSKNKADLLRVLCKVTSRSVSALYCTCRRVLQKTSLVTPIAADPISSVSYSSTK